MADFHRLSVSHRLGRFQHLLKIGSDLGWHDTENHVLISHTGTIT